MVPSEMSIGRYGACALSGQVGCSVKRLFLFGVLPLALTSASCATVNHGTAVKTAMATPAAKAPAAKTYGTKVYGTKVPAAKAPATKAPATNAPAVAADPAPVAPADSVFSPGVDVSVFLAEAQQARKSGDMTRAIKILSQLVLVAPDDAQVVGEYGKTLAAYGHSDDAIAFLDRAIQLQPGDWTLYSAQGVAYDQQGKFQSAQLSYDRAMQLKPGEVAIINNDALSHIQAGDYAGAQHLLNQVSRDSPDYSRISKSLALLAKLKPLAPAAAAIPQPAHELAQADSKPALRETAVAPAPAVTPTQETAVVQPATVIPKQDVVLVQPAPAIVPVDISIARAKPAPAAPVAPLRNTLDQLKADPSVVMAPVPADHPEVVVVQARLGDAGQHPAPKADHASSAESVAHAGPGFYVQAGSFLSDARARQASAGLESLDVKIMQGVVNGREVYRLRIGPFADRADAKKSFDEAKALGRSDLIIVRE